MHFHSTDLQRRRPDLSEREFRRLWRSHGDFAAGVQAFWDNVDRYVHNDPIEHVEGLAGIGNSYDAIGELYYSSYEDWLGMRSIITDTILPDERRVFAGPPLAVRGAITAFQPPRGAVKLFVFANFRTDDARLDAASRIAGHARDTFARADYARWLSGYTATVTRPPADDDGVAGSRHAASDRDVLLIQHFDDLDGAYAALGSADRARIEVAEDALFDWDSCIRVLTRGWILKDSPDPARPA